MQYDIQADVTHTIKLDFDAARSIVEAGSNTYILKPVIRILTESQGGAIKGVVVPASAHPAVYIFSGSDSASTYPDTNDRFF